eukprot:gene17367-19105_t
MDFTNTKSFVIFTSIILISTFGGVCAGSRRRTKKPMKCERITIPLCQKIQYNLTYVPNMFNHPTQTDAALHAHQFWPLVRINCSPDLKLFICSTHAPVCEENYGKPLLPCRSFCERVRDACSPIIKKHGMSWPEYLDCDKFPEKTHKTVCMEKNFGNKNNKKSPVRTEKTKTVHQPQPTVRNVIVDRFDQVTRKKNKGKIPRSSNALPTLPWNQDRIKGHTCGCMCQKPFVYINRSIEDGPSQVPSCAFRCKQYYFTPSQQNLTTFWITLWSFLCLIATFVTCMTAFVDVNRFKYPEKPIVCMAFCYLMTSSGYIVRLARGFESVACNSTTNLLRYSATGPIDCTIVFLLVYYFGMAGCLWWVILTLNWFLAAGMKWSKEAIASYSQYFHFVAWLIPTINSMAILAMAAIDSDPVSGLCYVGNHDNTMLTIFVIAPLLIFLTLGSSFFVAGMLALYNNRRLSANEGHTAPALDRLLVKIGVFALVCMLPYTITVLCHFYEHGNRESWEKSRNCPCVRNTNKPKHYIFLMKYFSALIVGIATGFWLWGTKTLDSWKRFLKHFCRRNNESMPKTANV